QDKYGAIARQQESGCCGPKNSCCGDSEPDLDVSIMAEDYSTLQGYYEGADLQLGCGLPTQFAHIKPGDTVVDLGSGAGNDCFVARAETGPTGKVIGVDFTDDMISRARTNVAKLGFDNVSFVQGDIEAIPLPDHTADVVVSNCVFNLVPDKQKAFTETYRILKPGGHFSISDIVLTGELPDGLKHAAAMYAGCVAGALQMDDYLSLIREAGFTGLEIQKKRAIELPQDVLDQFLSPDEQQRFNQENGIFSISVYAVR
ncbi:MAG: arsenite methyltransferase, partial [Lewinella sp.]|nr:arsenite methyltransferase [Lewinella sp.]